VEPADVAARADAVVGGFEEVSNFWKVLPPLPEPTERREKALGEERLWLESSTHTPDQAMARIKRGAAARRGEG
jgi:hypothetical protein